MQDTQYSQVDFYQFISASKQKKAPISRGFHFIENKTITTLS
jgi:hypothetical protein